MIVSYSKSSQSNYNAEVAKAKIVTIKWNCMGRVSKTKAETKHQVNIGIVYK